MRLFNIIEGWKNYLTNNKEIEELATERALKCVNCVNNIKSNVFAWVKDDIEEISASVCSKCECPIAMKVRSTNEKCPINKW